VRLQRLTSELGARVRLRWQPYALRPVPVPGAFRFAGSYVEAAWRRAAALAQEDGIVYRLWAGDEFPRWSMPALEAGVAAQRQGEAGFARFHLALFRALFVESRTITAPAVLTAVAREAGLDVDRFATALQTEEVRRDAREGFEAALNDCYVSAVPTVLVGTRRLIGLVPAAEYRAAIVDQLASSA